jgi:hypothetical protein
MAIQDAISRTLAAIGRGAILRVPSQTASEFMHGSCVAMWADASWSTNGRSLLLSLLLIIDQEPDPLRLPLSFSFEFFEGFDKAALVFLGPRPIGS